MAKKGKSFANKAQKLVSNEPAPEEPTPVAAAVPESEPTVPDPTDDKPEKFQTTIMMTDEAIELVGDIQRKYRRQNKKRITKGEVYELAIRNLAASMDIKP